MKHRFVPLFLVVALGMLLGGCVLDMTSPEAFEESLSKAGQTFEPSGGPTGFGSGGSNPDGMATGGSGSGGSSGGGSGPPPPGWPPDAGSGPSAPPSDSFSDPDGTTYGEYELRGPDYRRTQDEIRHGLAEGGYERDGPMVPIPGGGTEFTYTNPDTGGSVKVNYQLTAEGPTDIIRTTYIP